MRSTLLVVLSALCTALLALPHCGRAQTPTPLAPLISMLEKLPEPDRASALAASVSQEGHWTFANAIGERFTTASPEELKRVLPTLAPQAAKPGVRLTLLLSQDTIFRHRQYYLALPMAGSPDTDARIVVDGEAYPLVRRSKSLFAAIKPGLAVELTERRLFDETVWQLAHPLKQNTIRILALEPGSPTSLTQRAQLDPQTRQPLTDRIAPGSMIGALRTLRAQTVILTARIDGESLAFRPSSGPEVTLPLPQILAAAEAADVNLVVLQSATPRQPGTRSWLWQRVSVSRLGDAIARDHLADFLNALVTPEVRLLISARDAAPGRTRLTATQARNDSSWSSSLGEKLSDLAANVAGQVVVTGVETNLRNRERQIELDRRLLGAVPSTLQYGYLALALLGLAGHRVARRWWSGIWPPEARENYANVLGYQSARFIRGALYAALFLPLAALASAPLALAERLRRPRA